MHATPRLIYTTFVGRSKSPVLAQYRSFFFVHIVNNIVKKLIHLKKYGSYDVNPLLSQLRCP